MILKKEEMLSISEAFSKIPDRLVQKTCLKVFDKKATVEILSNSMAYIVSIKKDIPNISIPKDDEYVLVTLGEIRKKMDKALLLCDEMVFDKGEEYIEFNKFVSEDSKEKEVYLKIPLIIEKDINTLPHEVDDIFNIVVQRGGVSLDDRLELSFTMEELSSLLKFFSILSEDSNFGIAYNPKKGMICKLVENNSTTEMTYKFKKPNFIKINPKSNHFISEYGSYWVPLLSELNGKFGKNKNIKSIRLIIGKILTIFEIIDGDNSYIYAVTTNEENYNNQSISFSF
jgi:hypothetical protein